MTFEGMLFDVKKAIEYYVEADGVKSPTYAMKVVELPAVSKLELEYVFPAYTGLPPQKVEEGGDVAAISGTEIRVKVTSTIPTPGGRLKLDPGATAELGAQTDGTLTGSFKVAADGYYHVELDGARGERVAGSPKYTIDVIEDRAPSVTFEKPRRDTSASPVEEVFMQVKADDDFGVGKVELVYSVNGGEEKTVGLFGKGAKALTEVSAGHTLYMEELGVKPGDFVSYYAKAQDNDTVKGPKTTTSDIYFVQVRPFNQNFRQAPSQQAGGGGGGGGRGNEPGALSERQKQIISATFNVERDRPKTTAEKFKEDTVFIGLAQSKLREEVDGLVQQLRERLGGADENIRKIADLLPKASTEMKSAEDLLKGQKTKEARAPEQRALKFLQEAEQLYELEVRQGGGGGGGGGGGRPTGRGTADDPDVTQGRPVDARFDAPTRPTVQPWQAAPITDDQARNPLNIIPPDQRPRVALRFADQRELLVSGLLDGGGDIAQRPVVVDVPMQKGHVVLFANNPVWRGSTGGSYFMVFNTMLNWDNLNAGRKLDDK